MGTWYLCALVACCVCAIARAELLTPPYFNLAEGRRVTATATCGEGIEGPELFCKLIGSYSPDLMTQRDNLLIQGQVCDHCDPKRPNKGHPAEYAVDGTAKWWQSPPLSRGTKYNEVNLTIDLGQEFHVAYVIIKMANTPRPAVWVLEKSADNGVTYEPWQYFADDKIECERYFGNESLRPITNDTSVTCETQYSKIVPLENGEIFVPLLLNRPSANNFFNSTALQEFTRATNVRFRFLRTKNLLGHLMAVERQDPTVTRRYFYSVKDISIGGRCRCNGHADTCDITDPNDSYKLLCRCRHNTCGHNCEQCCPGYEQKAWRQSQAHKLFECEPCNCFGHSDECVYDETIDKQQQSLDIRGNYEGGGVCKNCRDNTKGINCNQCKDGFYRPDGSSWNQTDVCQQCSCADHRLTGNCAEGSGKCECRPEYMAPNCDTCTYGYFGYPNCRPCDCNLNGTRGYYCEAVSGHCPCLSNFGGPLCRECSPGYFGYPECSGCACNPLGAIESDKCDVNSGNCMCSANFGGRTCDRCGDGYFDFPQCKYCQCDVRGTEVGICDKVAGSCLCKPGFGGPRCDQCLPGYNGYPDCRPCGCSEVGSASKVCDATGKCPCLNNFVGRTCEQCAPGYYKYPECLACECSTYGSKGRTCDDEGKCQCKLQFDGIHCDKCKEGLYNFPLCEECNCNPAGVLANFSGCGSVPVGELCECKPRVTGRICDTCRPLYYNLQLYNSEGCDDCDCHLPGVVGSIAECNPKSGQCVCKPSVTSRRCDSCVPGTYDLRQDNMFGCTDCGCDVGGSSTKACNKETGQCMCHPKITGRTCKEPLQTYYFPTLHQFLYEVEDGHTPARTPVRYRFDEDIFPGFSWKGYAVFSTIQNEILRDDVHILKSSLYRMVLRYVNLNEETTTGNIKITPESQSDTEQTFRVAFKPTRTPSFVTVAGPNNGIPSPLVMNPGTWSVSIQSEKNLFVDYFVLLPGAYYEAAILVDHVTIPCKLGEGGTCRFFTFPNITSFDLVQGEGGYVVEGDRKDTFVDAFSLNEKEPNILPHHKIPLLTSDQQEVYFDLRVTKPGPHVLLLNYVTPLNQHGRAQLEVSVRTQTAQDKGQSLLFPCDYTIICRHIVLDRLGRVAVFNFDSNFVSLVIKKEGDANVAIESVVAIPEENWNLNYIKPKSVCVRKDGKCVQATFYTPAEAKKIEFEEGSPVQTAKELPDYIYSNSTGLIVLQADDLVVDVSGKVPRPGTYQFAIHYYQPYNPDFEMSVIFQNGQFYDAKLDVAHCPATSGCRALVKQSGGSTFFQLTENFMLTLKAPKGKKVWLDYVLILPSDANIERIMEEEVLDLTAEFFTQCGKDSFHIDERTTGFCRDAVFSITSAYNSGALHCQCDFDGSLSFECKQFGGQCPCKPNVIGRKCDACKSGYFGFPNCQPCNCPSRCTDTGECVCPQRVTGKNCEQCENYTYGYDLYNGCEDCNCNPFGVQGSQQCDILTGVCPCKPNIVGRTCDHCQSGFSNFPHCQKCDCDLRGTTSVVCDQETAECFCKPNVDGQACDLCMDGTFNIQEKNKDGCTKCFCFGKTTRCMGSSLYKDQIKVGEGWKLSVVNQDKTGNWQSATNTDIEAELISPDSVMADLTNDVFVNQTVFFSAPEAYLGKKLTSYGGALTYDLLYTTGPFGSAVAAADVVIHGADTHLLYFGLEQPAASEAFSTSVDMVETNFVLPSGLAATREQIMQVLEQLQGLYIRATYSEQGVTTRLMKFSLDSATEEYRVDAESASSVEQCQCPQAYQGLSCEECADGYYRAATGPYGGFCVPCQCNGHAATCNKVTGICQDCKHNTTGDHCENCAVGYHGNATTGTPYDCLICACPLPIPSNNFATSCEVSEDGEKISCECEAGYFGARCESCAAGYYGEPEKQGEICKPCKCSGNIDPSDPASCDTLTGNCTRCLHNTFGNTCQLCAPGYFGDAMLRDCQSCVCDVCGTAECDHDSGRCQCLSNVVGDKCDRCEDRHYGFSTCQGCKPCDCQLASDSLQCEEISGQCRCKPGVVGRNCDRCISGYWQYSAEGCISCECNKEYSIGVGCNTITGQCECLPGVIGEKCDACPDRWVLKPDEGCFECDTCHHALLDITDSLALQLLPVTGEFKSVAASFFTTQRLSYFNDSVLSLRPDVNSLALNVINTTPQKNAVNELETESHSLNRKAQYKVESAQGAGGGKRKQEAHELEALVFSTVKQSKATVIEIKNLAMGLEVNAGPQVDQALNEAKHLLEDITSVSFSDTKYETDEGQKKAVDLLGKVKEFARVPGNITEELKALRDRISKLNHDKMDDLINYAQQAEVNIHKAETLNSKNRNSSLSSRLNNIKYLKKDTNLTLADAKEYVQSASKLLNSAKSDFNTLPYKRNELETLKNNTSQKKNNLADELQNINYVLSGASDHAKQLAEQADRLDGMFSKTRTSSDSAVKAANAYADIVTAIGNAHKAADAAVVASDDATAKSNGLAAKSQQVSDRNKQLLLEVTQAHSVVQGMGGPEEQLATILDNIQLITKMNSHTNSTYNQIKRGLDNIPTLPLDSIDRMENLDAVSDNARGALTQIKGDVDAIPQHLLAARTLVKDNQRARDNIRNANAELDKVKKIFPDITNLVDQLKAKPQELADLGESIRTDLDELRNKIAMARNFASKIKVGATYFQNTTSELRNPESISHQGLNSHVSVYLKTNVQNGLIFYLGNEKGTSRKMRRSISDDFMALQIENGYPLLTIDLGSGPEQLIHDQYIANDSWYQAIIDRNGKNVRFTIKTELTPKEFKEQSQSLKLKGMSTLLNLDKEHSKLFVGGFPNTFDIQPAVKYSGYEGKLEELMIGDTQVSLWNFEDAANLNTGAKERDKLVNVVQETGYRFNGDGYVEINGSNFNVEKRSDILMSFKTFAEDGLLFVAYGSNIRSKRETVRGKWMAVEIKGGHVIYQYFLNSKPIKLESTYKYNDGQWHTVSARRDGLKGFLELDNDKETRFNPTNEDKGGKLEVEHFYFGGLPTNVHMEGVTTPGFDGCIDVVQVDQINVQLTVNINSFGVLPGCPVKFSSVVSIEEGARGYLLWSNATATDNMVQLILKVKTTSPSGVIAYAVDGRASSSVMLEDGNIIFSSGGQSVSTSPSTKYNDGQWHTIVATSQTGEPLLLDIDDYDNFTSHGPAVAMRLLHSNLYFGGVPSRVDAALALQPHFYGCISDATLNGEVVNFANLTDTYQVVVGKCLWDEQTRPLFIVPPGREKLPIDAPAAPKDNVISSGQDIASPELESDQDGDEEETLEPEPLPQTTTAQPLTPAPTPVPNCKLPLFPASDPAITSTSGLRFVTRFNSRVEYKPPRLRNNLDMSITIKTVSAEGIIMYMHDRKHIDFVALYHIDGKVHYGFNCGSGPALLQSERVINDGEWHSIRFKRNKIEGELYIDQDPAVTGESSGSATTINVESPLYLGGIDLNSTLHDNTLINLRGLNNSFEGCIKNFKNNNKHVFSEIKSVGVIPCSEKVESGVFFYADGGYLKHSDKFRVGKEMDIKLELKPRDLSGLLMSVHSKKDYLLLQMVNGTVRFSVDNGKGEISAAFVPSTPHYFCDGQWHSIRASKSKNVVSLSVDTVFVDPGIGLLTDTDTNHPLYIGGHPPKEKNVKRLLTQAQFTGCIRNLEINGKSVALNQLPAVGNVTQSVCPTI